MNALGKTRQSSGYSMTLGRLLEGLGDLGGRIDIAELQQPDVGGPPHLDQMGERVRQVRDNRSLDGAGGDEGSCPGPARDQPLALQLGQRAANRDARHVVQVGEIGLGWQACARHELARRNPVAKREIDPPRL